MWGSETWIIRSIPLFDVRTVVPVALRLSSVEITIATDVSARQLTLVDPSWIRLFSRTMYMVSTGLAHWNTMLFIVED